MFHAASLQAASRWLAAAVAVVAAATVAIIGAAALPAAAQTAGFGDVPQDAYYATPVADLHTNGVFNGTLCDDGFCPSEPMDRKTMAVWTVRVLDGQDPPPITRSRFNDVDPDSFHARFIERLAELDVTRGCGDGTGFCPDRNVTRAQMAAFLSRAYDLPPGTDPDFSDVPDDAWYAADVASLAASGITVGCGDSTAFCPGRDTTRGQMATFLYRANERHLRIQTFLDAFDYDRDGIDPNRPAGSPILRLAVQSDTTSVCLQPAVPNDLSNSAEILRIDSSGCMTLTYEPLRSRTLADVRRQYSSDPSVISIELSRQFRLNAVVQTRSQGEGYWHMTRVDIGPLNSIAWPTNAHVNIAILDTGIDARHDELVGSVYFGGEDSEGNTPLEDPHGHGTFIAGLIAADPHNGYLGGGVAPNARLTSYRMRVSNGVYSDAGHHVVQLLEYIKKWRYEIDVVNMSFGTYDSCSYEGFEDVATRSDVYTVFVASAGNDRRDLQDYQHSPSGCDGVLEVAATDRNGDLANFSNYGPEVVLAPGNDLKSIKPGGDAETGSGTSYSAPIVAAIAAHLRAWFPGATGPQIVEAIQQSASHGSKPDSKEGYGHVQPLEAIKYLDDLLGEQVYCNFEPDAPSCSEEEEPEVHVILELGDSALADGVCTGVSCRWLHVDVQGDIERALGPGPYTLGCAHDGVAQTGFSRGVYRSTMVAEWPSTRDCFFGYPGTKVFVVVGAERQGDIWYGGIYSNIIVWPDCTIEPDRSNPDRCTAGGEEDLELEISWGSDATGRTACRQGQACRNLSYEYLGDWPSPTYSVECWGNGQRLFGPFQWSGRPHTGCYYWGGTAQVVINGIRSNVLQWEEPDDGDEQDDLAVKISWGSDATGRTACRQGQACRNLSYEYLGDWPSPTYSVECWGNGQRLFGPFQWSGRPHTGCYYWGGTAQVVINGIRSNVLQW